MYNWQISQRITSYVNLSYADLFCCDLQSKHEYILMGNSVFCQHGYCTQGESSVTTKILYTDLLIQSYYIDIFIGSGPPQQIAMHGETQVTFVSLIQFWADICHLCQSCWNSHNGAICHGRPVLGSVKSESAQHFLPLSPKALSRKIIHLPVVDEELEHMQLILWSQRVLSSVKVAGSHIDCKWGNISEMMHDGVLLQTINRKCWPIDITYISWQMTLCNLQGHLPTAAVIKCDFRAAVQQLTKNLIDTMCWTVCLL